MNVHSDYRADRYLDVFLLDKGQINISIIYPGTIVAFHRHKKQIDHWLVVQGTLEVITVTEDKKNYNDINIDNYILKDGVYREGFNTCIGPLMIASKVWHGYRCLGNEPAILIYYVTEKYDSSNPDEERITPEKLGVEFSSQIK
jgi:dTDP-4-dehydrorhamnose 3,5-epimerase